MYLKKKLMKAASICSYVCSAIWFVAAASAFALSDYTYWLFLIFALLSLYGQRGLPLPRQLHDGGAQLFR